MKIVIPLCGKGERFKSFYNEYKPYIKLYNKMIIEYVIENLKLSSNDTIYIIVNNRTYSDKLIDIANRYNRIQIVNINKETLGAAETVYLGLKHINNSQQGITIVDCDNFYTINVLKYIKDLSPQFNSIVSFNIENEKPIFSYVTIDRCNPTILSNNVNAYDIFSIREKEKISDYANTGIYHFKDTNEFISSYEELILKLNINAEIYISTIIDHMLKFKPESEWLSIVIPSSRYFSLGDPQLVDKFLSKTYTFLFDLDGTLVLTDEIYFNVWKTIFEKYDTILTKEIYQTYIYSNSDKYVLHKLLNNAQIDIHTLSNMKDNLFIKYIDNLDPYKINNLVVTGAKNFMKAIKNNGHNIAVVTNSNKNIAKKILEITGLDKFVKVVIASEDCIKHKPNPEPYIKAIEYFNTISDKVVIFEDSLNGILAARGCGSKCIIGINTSGKLSADNVDLLLDNFPSSINAIESIFHKSSKQKIINYIKQSINNSNINGNINSNRDNRDNKNITIDIHDTKLKSGFIANVTSVSIVLNDSNKSKTHIILKTKSEQQSSLKNMATQLHLYENEQMFYECLSNLIPINIPKFYGTLYNENLEPIGIMIENLFEKNTIHTISTIENINTAFLIIDEVVKLHSKFWRKSLDSNFPISRNNDKSHKSFCKEFLESKINDFLDRWNFLIPEKVKNLIVLSINMYNKIQDSLSNEPLTLCHGDFKVTNMFFEKHTCKCNNVHNVHNKENYIPYFIDWQYVSYGKGVKDLVFFMIESFDEKFIQKYYKIMIEYYYIKLIENGISDYTKDNYIYDIFNSMLLYPLFVAVWFGTISSEDLIDSDFPMAYINKLVNFYQLILDDNEYKKMYIRIG